MLWGLKLRSWRCQLTRRRPCSGDTSPRGSAASVTRSGPPRESLSSISVKLTTSAATHSFLTTSQCRDSAVEPKLWIYLVNLSLSFVKNKDLIIMCTQDSLVTLFNERFGQKPRSAFVRRGGDKHKHESDARQLRGLRGLWDVTSGDDWSADK